MSAYEIIRRPPERSDFSDEVYSMIGRALTLASRFEASCKALALLMGIRRRSSDGSFSLSRVEDLESLVSKISERRLFQEIKSVVECLNFPEDAKKLFHAARADRNFVAHELTFGIEHLLESDEELEALKSDLALRVHRLATADLAICLLMLIETREPLPTLEFISAYSESVQRWVCA